MNDEDLKAEWTSREFAEEVRLEAARQRRIEHCQKVAKECATWSSRKLRACYAQPETVKRAEEREAREAGRKLTPYQRIMRAADAGRGLRLSAEEVLAMSNDSAIVDLSLNDDEDDQLETQ